MRSIPALLLTLVAVAPAIVTAQAPPRWFVAELRQLATGGDAWWVADNAPFTGPDEPFVRYATRWLPADDGRTLTGELVAIDTAGRRLPMWTYRMYWHPGEQQGYLMQTSSWGAYGIGPLRVDSSAVSRITVNDQEFWQPDGGSSRSRHRSWFEGDSIHVTESLQWRDGAWQPGRTYRWRRTADGATGE